MPRVTSGKSSPGSHSLTTEQYADVTRESAAAAGAETIESIKRIQKQVRDKDGRLKNAKFIASVLALRFENFSLNQIAEVLGVGYDKVKTALERARGDQTIDSLLDRLDRIVLPAAVENVYRGVLDGDKEYTLRVLDGRGIFRTHKSIDAQVKKTVLMLKVNITTPAHLKGSILPTAKVGAIVGAPMLPTGLPPAEVLEGVIVKSEPAPKADL